MGGWGRRKERRGRGEFFVLFALLSLSSSSSKENKLLPAYHLERLLQRRLLLLAQNAVHLGQVLAVLANGVTPLDVLVGRLLEVPVFFFFFLKIFYFIFSGEFFLRLQPSSFFLPSLSRASLPPPPTPPPPLESKTLLHLNSHLQVVERVLRHVGDPQVRVLPDLSRVGLRLAREQLDHRRLARAVGARHGDARVEAALHGHAVEDQAVRARVRKRDVAELEDGAVLGLDTLEERRLREDELKRRRRELVVGAGRRVLKLRFGFLLREMYLSV